MKKILATFMSICLALSLSIQGFAVDYGAELNPEEKTYEQTFSDVPTTHWGFEYIAELVERGAISGYPDGKFYPNNTVSREAFAKIMTVAAGVPVNTVSYTGFMDVAPTSWSAPYIVAAKPYMTAYSGGTMFKPTQNALREDIAVAVVLLKGYDVSVADVGMIQTMFSDYNQISESLRPYVAVALERGIISGYSDGTFRAQNTVTRAEAAAMLWRAFEYSSDDKVVVGETTLPTVLPTPTPDITDPILPTIAPTQTPEPTAISYVETLAEIPTGVSDYTYTEDGDLYYIKNNKVFSVIDGNTMEIADGETSFVSEYTLEELVLQGNAYLAYYQQESYGYNKEELMYIDEVEIMNISYNSLEDEIYFDYYVLIEDAFYIPNYGAHQDVQILALAEISNVDSVLSMQTTVSDGFKNPPVISTSELILSDYVDYINGDLYSFNSYGISKFDYTSGSYEDLNIIDLDSTVKDITELNGELYFTTYYGIYTLENAGTNRFKPELFFDFDNLEVKDRVAFKGMDSFMFDDDGNVVFADETNDLIRKLAIVE